MLVDPIVVAISGANHSLSRYNQRGMASDYRNVDSTVFETVSHQLVPTRKSESGPGVLSLVELSQRKVVVDPLNAERQEFKTLRVHIKIDRPEYGFSVAEVDAVVAALKAQLTTAFVTQVYGLQS